MSEVAGAEQLRRLLSAVVAIGSEPTLPLVLRRIVEVAADLVDARYGALGVLDRTRTRLAEFITVGMDDEDVAAIAHPPRGRGVLGRLITDRQPLRLTDLTAHPDSQGFPPDHPAMRSFLGVPVWVGGEAFGNLYLTEKSGGRPFTAVDEELVVGLAAAAGVAIENARLHERAQQALVLADRERIARDLHDTVIQRLFATGLLLQGAARLAERPEAVERIDQAIDDLDLTVRHIRSVIFGLQPMPEGDRSVRRAVLEVAAEQRAALGFDPAVRFEGPVDAAVDERLAEDLVNVVREALSNVARHARARHAELEVAVGDRRLCATVADDGVGAAGFQGASGAPGPFPALGSGRGLPNMAERAQRLGGSLELGPGPEGRGLVLRWCVPLDWQGGGDGADDPRG